MHNTGRPASAREAIELLTAWLDTPTGPPDLMIDCLRSHLHGRSDSESLANAIELIMGMTYVCGFLLSLHEHETGISAHETVQSLALEFARD